MDTVFDDLTSAYTSWSEAHVEAALRQLHHCRTGAASRYLGEWYRLYGLCLQSSGETNEAEKAFLDGINVAQSPQQLARLHNTYAVHLEFGARMEEAIDHYLAAEHLFRQTHDTESAVSNVYNIAHAYLQVGRFNDASHKFDSAVSLNGRAHSRASHTLTHAGRSLVALIRGQPHLAIERAALARSKGTHPVYEIRALQMQITVLTTLGQRTEARLALNVLRRIRSMQDDPVERGTLDILTGILDDDPAALAHVPSGIHPSWQVRALLHRARLSADPHEAVRLAQAARARHQRHEEAIFDVMFPEMHRQLIAWGVPLTRAVPTGPTVLTVSIRGVLRLAVNTEVIQSRLPAASAAVLAALITDGPLTTASLLRDVLGTEKAASLDRAVERVCLLIGDETAITSQGDGWARRWSLSAAYQWRLDETCTGSVLGGLDSPYAQRCELA